MEPLSVEAMAEIDQMTRGWRDLPSLNPILRFPCWRVPKQGSTALQILLESEMTQKYLASRMETWCHIRRNRKVRLIQTDPRDDQYKLVLLHPDTPLFKDLPETLQELLRSNNVDGTSSPSPDSGTPHVYTHQMRYSDFTVEYILERVLPQECHPPPSSYEQIGHVAHLNLRSVHLPYRYLIGDVILGVVPGLRTVIQKVGEVSGPYRTYPYEIVAELDEGDRAKATTNNAEESTGKKSSTVVSFPEWGVGLQFDVRDVYWSSRLSTERKRLIQKEFRKGQWIADAFCGVGALCLQAALHKKCVITANDWNPAAIEALKQNVKSNKLTNSFHEITCGDAYEFLTSLGLSSQQQPTQQRHGQNDEADSHSRNGSLPSDLPHHVVLNYPLDSASFLGALRWWRPSRSRGSRRGGPKKKHSEKEQDDVVPRVHVYLFAKEPGESKSEISLTNAEKNRMLEQQAVNEVASHLLPVLPGQASSSGTMTRWEELDQNFGCNVHVHNVRDVAPGKTVYCVSFSATNRLLRYMQGNFYDDPDDEQT